MSHVCDQVRSSSTWAALKEGRKALILVSEGYSNMLPPQMRDPNASFPGFGNPNCATIRMPASKTRWRRAAYMASLDMEADLRDIWDLANKNNTAIYAVDPRGLATNEFGIDQNIGQTDSTYLLDDGHASDARGQTATAARS